MFRFLWNLLKKIFGPDEPPAVAAPPPPRQPRAAHRSPPRAAPQQQTEPDCPAVSIMKSFNENMLIGEDGQFIVGIEDHYDEPGGKLYRIEFQATRDGRHANAWVRYNPWDPNRPNAGCDYHEGHVNSEGFLCLSAATTHDTANSGFDLDFAIKRARFWCTAFSYWQETGDSSIFNS